MSVHEGIGVRSRSPRAQSAPGAGCLPHQGLNGFEVALFQLRHAAAGFLLGEHVRDLVVVEDLGEVVGDARLVVVHVAGGEDRDLARECARRRAPGGSGWASHSGGFARSELGHPRVLRHGLRPFRRGRGAASTSTPHSRTGPPPESSRACRCGSVLDSNRSRTGCFILPSRNLVRPWREHQVRKSPRSTGAA
jgi:hypothetical protein